MLSPEEIAVLEGSDADTHLATMGDTVLPGETTPAAAAEVESDSTQDTDATDDKPADGEAAPAAAAPEKTEAAAEPEPAPAAQPKPQAFDVPDTAALTDQRKALRDEKRDLTKKWSAGEVTDEEYADQVDALDDKLSTLVAAQTEAATLHRINAQNEARAKAEAEAAENQAMFATAQASKSAGLIDYGTNKVAAAQFDSLFAAAKIDPANAKLSAQQVVEKAHKAVLALNGLAEAPKPKAEAAAPAAPAPRNVPPSIGGLPNASQTVVQDELLAQFNQLEGDDAERFMASLNDKQVERLMRMSDGRGVH
jgi:electron transport complex protein RnfC